MRGKGDGRTWRRFRQIEGCAVDEAQMAARIRGQLGAVESAAGRI
jgi:hypothetical protein